MILLHSCCGPCAEWPAHVLRDEGQDVRLHFYNPNIQPETEWSRRREAFVQMAELRNFAYFIDGTSEEEVWRSFTSEKKSVHCRYCYTMRMLMTAKKAKEESCSAFTTSLLVSPYQDHEMIYEAMDLAAKRYGVTALKRDFRDGYSKGQEMALEDSLYRQKYCACIYSILESPRFLKKITKELNLDRSALPSRLSNE